ncbi:MAG: hypothetical protein JNM66_15395 [Bryobacterales bacterium]|nr:hypothetical protein [Bryobacterales bacterium]
MATANTIDEVIDALTSIIEQAKANRSRLGYFPALYRRVTRAVKNGIANGRFEDGPRMERLDVVFANRYLSAYYDWHNQRPVSQCWNLAFSAAARTDRIITQHLLLGINAHINLDLAVAAAEVAPGPAIHALAADFRQINKLLYEQVGDVQDAIASVAPLMWLLDIAGGQAEERMVEFSLLKARDAAWMQSLVLAEMTGGEQREAIRVVDAATSLIGAGVLDPPGWRLRLALQAIVRTENADVANVIQALA